MPRLGLLQALDNMGETLLLIIKRHHHVRHEPGGEEAVIIKVEDVDTREELPSVDRLSLPSALM